MEDYNKDLFYVVQVSGREVHTSGLDTINEFIKKFWRDEAKVLGYVASDNRYNLLHLLIHSLNDTDISTDSAFYILHGWDSIEKYPRIINRMMDSSFKSENNGQ